MLKKLKSRARALKNEAFAVYWAAQDPRTPWYAKALAGAIVAYAISPIDLIPDFIPVLGLLDELVLLPVAIWLALRLIPPEVMAEARGRAEQASERPTSRVAAAFIVAIWLGLAGLAVLWAWRYFAR